MQEPSPHLEGHPKGDRNHRMIGLDIAVSRLESLFPTWTGNCQRDFSTFSTLLVASLIAAFLACFRKLCQRHLHLLFLHQRQIAYELQFGTIGPCLRQDTAHLHQPMSLQRQGNPQSDMAFPNLRRVCSWWIGATRYKTLWKFPSLCSQRRRAASDWTCRAGSK